MGNLHTLDHLGLIEIWPVEIVHCHLFTYGRDVVVFTRQNGYLGPVSGEVEIGETYIDAAVREVFEETGLRVRPDMVIMTDHTFSGVSPKGKPIFGFTCFTFLPRSFDPAQFRLNGELITYKILSLDEAIKLLAREGMPEAKKGLHMLLMGI